VWREEVQENGTGVEKTDRGPAYKLRAEGRDSISPKRSDVPGWEGTLKKSAGPYALVDLNIKYTGEEAR